MAQAREIGWDDAPTSVGGGKLKKFKGKVGKTYRVVILTERPVRTFNHFKKPFGYFTCLKGEGQECVACNAGESVTEKYAVNILLYPDNAGPNGAFRASDVEILAWQMGPKIFSDLKKIKDEWGPLTGLDVKLECTNEQYQHIDATVCKEQALASHPEVAQIIAIAQQGQFDLKKVFASKETVDEVNLIWTTNITRDELKKRREKGDHGAPAPAPVNAAALAASLLGAAAPSPVTAALATPPVAETPATPVAAEPPKPAALPDFAAMLRGTAA